jgi:hypothetical protein
MIQLRKAAEEDFPKAFEFIRALWDYNTCQLPIT